MEHTPLSKLIEHLSKLGISNSAVLKAMREVPRDRFVLEGYQEEAYKNEALPLQFGQTISQPYVVAKMTELLLGPNQKLHKVLEIGTGSGYQAAILSHIADEVYTIERIGPLATRAKFLLNALGYSNIFTDHADGTAGWETHSPYDGIIVTAAAPAIEKAWINQLAVGGRLVVPVCNEKSAQTLEIIEHTELGTYSSFQADQVVFVPLKTGKQE